VHKHVINEQKSLTAQSHARMQPHILSPRFLCEKNEMEIK
jgi:hypothetical protein